APDDFARQHRDLPFAPPSRIHLIDDAGRLHAWPFVYRLARSDSGSYEEDRSRKFSIRLLSAGTEHRIFGRWASRAHLFGVAEPGNIFLFGTDDFGRDQFTRFVYGARISLLARAIGTIIALLVGVPCGVISGYYGKWANASVMWLVEL